MAYFCLCKQKYRSKLRWSMFLCNTPIALFGSLSHRSFSIKPNVCEYSVRALCTHKPTSLLDITENESPPYFAGWATWVEAEWSNTKFRQSFVTVLDIFNQHHVHWLCFFFHMLKFALLHLLTFNFPSSQLGPLCFHTTANHTRIHLKGNRGCFFPTLIV